MGLIKKIGVSHKIAFFSSGKWYDLVKQTIYLASPLICHEPFYP